MNAMLQGAAAGARLFVLAAAALAAGCGGGTADTAEPTTPPLALSGTAATGAALSGALVQVKCAGAGGSTVTASNGDFSLELAGAALPCVLRATAASGGTVLHSLASGSGSSAHANLTPASELVLAALTAGTPAASYNGFDGSAPPAWTPQKVQAAVTVVVNTLKAAGVDFSASADLLGGALVAAVGGQGGNAQDQALDALQARLGSARTSLAALADALAAVSPNGQKMAQGLGAVPPAEVLLAAAAPNCSALRSGRYRLVLAEERSSGHATEVVLLDAEKLSLSAANGTVTALQANGNCRYTSGVGGDLAVSPAGILVGQYKGSGSALRAAVLFPEQTHGLDSLAGDWNFIGYDRTVDDGPVHPLAGSWSFDAAGKVSAITFCDDMLVCASGTAADTTGFPVLTSKPNTAGGFDLSNAAEAWTDRLFAFRSGSGELLLVDLSSTGALKFFSRQASAALPAAAQVDEAWVLTLNAGNSAQAALVAQRSTVQTVSPGSGIYSRSLVIDNASGATRHESLSINNPRSGWVRRLSASATASNGQASAISEFVGLPLRGMGLAAQGLGSSNELQLLVAR